ncbi:jerky protein homolog-like [Rhopalosiphum padi]|uniref:jerky protein homolog-like n=1 Tax=Rhopalosiphum padi TaxID=40932 RepID=UPI00298D854F|nr:jerky protein homolog-like [Rhopalosiphum padi]
MWFCQERRKGTPISGPIIKEKAIALHKKLEAGSEFTASEGWIDRWKTRHGVRFVSITGEKLSADAEAAKKFAMKFREIVEQYELLPCQVYNIDETGLNYKMLPNKTLASSNDTVAGTKLIQDRLIIAPCSNADGTHKLPLFVIGKSKKPRAFKNINLSSLPVYYRNQKSAWMDCYLFKSWFIDEFVPSVETDLNQK